MPCVVPAFVDAHATVLAKATRASDCWGCAARLASCVSNAWHGAPGCCRIGLLTRSERCDKREASSVVSVREVQRTGSGAKLRVWEAMWTCEAAVVIRLSPLPRRARALHLACRASDAAQQARRQGAPEASAPCCR